MKKTGKWLAFLMALVMASALSVGCGSKSGVDGSAAQDDETSGAKTNTEKTEDAAGEKVFYAGSTSMYGATNLDPADDWNGWYLSFFGVTENLFKLDEAYNAIPNLVESYEEPADGVTWKFTLRDDVAFSNGEKMTAQSVVDCFNRTLEISPRGTATLNIESMSADGQVLTLVTPEADPTFLYSLCDPLLSVYYVDDTLDYDTLSYCTGPFVVEEFTAEKEAVLVKNENYWGGDVKIDRAHLITFGDEDSMVMAMQNGELDIIDGTGSAVMLCNESTGFHVLSVDTSRAEKMIFNHKDGIFGSDSVIREVIALSIDRDGYAAMSNGVVKANYGIYPASLSYGDNSKLDIKITGQDLDAAVAALDTAGYTDTDGDGIREKDGTPLSLTLVYSGTGYQDFCDVLASDLRSIGVEMKTASYENLDSFETYAGVEWDLCISGKYMTPTGDASYFFDQDVITDGVANYGYYSNPEIDALADELHRTFGEEERNEIVYEMEQILLDDNSFIVYANGTNTYITSSRVSGYTPSPSNYYYLDQNVDVN